MLSFPSRKHDYIILTPRKPHFLYSKTGFYRDRHYFSYVLHENINCSNPLKRLAETVLTSTHNLCFEQKYEKYQSFLSENFQFLLVKFSIYLNRHVFVMMLFNSYQLS